MSDLPSVQKQKPKYFKIEEFFLKLAGISLTGNEGVAYKIYSRFIMYCLLFPYMIISSIQLFQHEISSHYTETIVYGIGAKMSTLVTAVTYFNRLKLGKLLIKMENEPFLANAERGGDKEKILMNGWISFKWKQSLALRLVVSTMYICRVLLTMSTRLRSNDYNDWEFGFGTMSILNVAYSPNYEILWMYQNIAVFFMAINLICTILILVAIMAHVTIQFKILQNNLRRLVTHNYINMLQVSFANHDATNAAHPPLNATEINASTISWKYLKYSLREAVFYHLAILQNVADVVEIFSNTILIIYLCSIGICCLEVYRISMLPLNDIRLPMQLLETLGGSMFALVICYSGQRMTDESLKVADAAYETIYAGVDLRFQKDIRMILRRSQRPIIIKAGKFIETSMITYLWIVRTAYSTYMVLRNVQKE